MSREHGGGNVGNAEQLISSLLREFADLERNCAEAKEGNVVNAFATPHARRNGRLHIRFILKSLASREERDPHGVRMYNN
mmetsp:Transcript_34993/g.74645  ORF Transcript_34993/g.74645 Transcript_34993/m.74645 type:complete len:80 (-) Transcript_34993:36-275(-)